MLDIKVLFFRSLCQIPAIQDAAVLHQIPVSKSMTGLFKGGRKLPQTVHRSANASEIADVLILFHNIFDLLNIFLLLKL